MPKRFNFTPPAYSGHTLIGAILDAHPQVVVSNTYGPKVESVEAVIKQTRNVDQWIGPKYIFSIEGQGEIKDLKVYGTTTMSWTENELQLTCIRNPFEIYKAHTAKLKDRDKAMEACNNTWERLESYPSFKIIHEIFIYEPHSLLKDLTQYLKIDYNNEWVEKASSIIRTDLPKRHIDISKEEEKAIRQAINKYKILEVYK